MTTISTVWNALTALREEADRYTLHTRPDDLPTVRSARLAAAALEYAAAHLDAQQPDGAQAATLRRWAVEFRGDSPTHLERADAPSAPGLSTREREALDWLRRHCRADWAVPEAHLAASALDRLLGVSP